MLAIERHRRILELLEESGTLRTVETALELGVTDETVRKDFEALEKRGDLVRMHGGAGKPERPRDVPFNERQLIRRDEKRVIAYAEDVVFLADHSKLGEKSAFFFSSLADVDCLVTDRYADPNFLKKLTKAGIEVLQGG